MKRGRGFFLEKNHPKKSTPTHQRRRPLPGLGRHHFGPSVLRARRQGLQLRAQVLDGRRLREQRQDRHPGVAADDGDLDAGDVLSRGPGVEGAGADDVERGDAEEAARVVDTFEWFVVVVVGAGKEEASE